MLLIGLTGGIGAGKSTAAARLAQLGAVVIDSDRLARQVVEPGTEGLRTVVAAFGPDLVGADGSLDRAALGNRVFGDEAARRRLEAIVHPLVRGRTVELIAAAPPDAVVVNDVPLLVEAGLAATFHLVLVVASAPEVRVGRLAGARGMTEAEAWARIRAQASDEQRDRVADVVLRNDGTRDELVEQVDATWWDRLCPYEENLRLRRPARVAGGAGQRGPALADQPGRVARLTARLGWILGGAPNLEVISGPDPLRVRLSVARDVSEELAVAGFPPDGAGHVFCSADPGNPIEILADQPRPA